MRLLFFFFNDTATTEIYTLSLHDALPITRAALESSTSNAGPPSYQAMLRAGLPRDRKSTRLNSSHMSISYAVFCLKKKKFLCNRLIQMFHKPNLHQLLYRRKKHTAASL